MDAKYEGAEMTIAFNPQYLAEGVEAVVGDEVVLETIDALKPATLKPTDKSGLRLPADACARGLETGASPSAVRRCT